MSSIVGKILAGAGAAAAVIVAIIVADKQNKRNHYDQNGYNTQGYDREGFDKDGFNKKGFDRDGYDRSGFNQDGFDKEGYNREGLDRRGFDRSGFNARGFDKSGFNADGYDWKGFDSQGYNADGIDRSGNTKKYYAIKIHEMEENSRTAKEQMNLYRFPYALRDIRVGLERGVKAILAHKLGKGYEDNSLNDNLTVCSRNKIFDQDFTEKIHSAKTHCNDTSHEDCEKTHEQVYFCRAVLNELIDELKRVTDV